MHGATAVPDRVVADHLGHVTTEGCVVFYGDVVADVEAFDAGGPVRVLTS